MAHDPQILLQKASPGRPLLWPKIPLLSTKEGSWPYGADDVNVPPQSVHKIFPPTRSKPSSRPHFPSRPLHIRLPYSTPPHTTRAIRVFRLDFLISYDFLRPLLRSLTGSKPPNSNRRAQDPPCSHHPTPNRRFGSAKYQQSALRRRPARNNLAITSFLLLRDLPAVSNQDRGSSISLFLCDAQPSRNMAGSYLFLRPRRRQKRENKLRTGATLSNEARDERDSDIAWNIGK